MVQVDLIHKRIAKINPAKGAVRVVGVIKGQSPAVIEEAVCQGLTELGVNYIQEGSSLRERIVGAQLQWHFIGGIQSRKVRNLTDYSWIQSLDRLSVVEELDRRLSDSNKSILGLAQVNIGREPQKSGLLEEDLENFVVGASHFKRIKLRGLMCLPPPLYPVAKRTRDFLAARSLFEKYEKQWGWDTLSMGTSEDFEVAVECGANMVRLGEILFGPRS